MSNTRAASIVWALALVLASQHSAHAWWFTGEAVPVAPAAPAVPAAPPVAAPPAAYAQANVQQTLLKKQAVAQFDLDGVHGTMRFVQSAPGEPTTVEYDLHGLRGNNKLYHVHVRPVPQYDSKQVSQNATKLAEVCGDVSTGGHLNPHHITAKLPPKSAPLDKYEIGDLSGKHGPLLQTAVAAEDRYIGSYVDPMLPMSGDNNIIGRSIVIHKNDGKRWVCASIIETKP